MEVSRLIILGWVTLNIDLSCIRLVTAIPKVSRLTPDGVLYVHEHGPQGGDEINRIEPGLNYGWPTITYGRNYGIGTTIGEGVAKEGLEQPLLHWNPSIAPSWYGDSTSGKAFPEWQNSLFVGCTQSPDARFDWSLKMDSSNRKNDCYRRQSGVSRCETRPRRRDLSF
jgi:glucose/arabinose dehydrogenase